jgi:hypothetical protein
MQSFLKIRGPSSDLATWGLVAANALLLVTCASSPSPAPSTTARLPRVQDPPIQTTPAGPTATPPSPANPPPADAAPSPPASAHAEAPDAGTAKDVARADTEALQPRPAVLVPSGPGWSIITTAPEGMTAADLGRPFDASFQPLAGSGPLFKPKPRESYPVFRHSVALVEDQVTLAATMRSWGLTSDAGRSRRFASYRAEQITDIQSVDDMVPPQAAPSTAMYYLAKVYYGRSYEVRLSGDEGQFTSNLAGTFLSGKLDGGMKGFAEKNRLEFTAVGRGLRPKSGAAIYAKDPSEIEANYTVEGSTTVPVEVEYRLIPGHALPDVQPIAWHKLLRYRVELSAIEAHRCERTSECDLNVSVSRVDSRDKPTAYRGPDDTDVWEPRYLILESTDESELFHGFNFEVFDRNLTFSRMLGRCQVRIDQRKLQALRATPDRRIRWTELCGKAQIRLTLTSEDVQP